LRRRILEVAMASVLLAVVVLGVPLAYAVDRVVAAEERAELERLALRSAVAVSPRYLSGDPVELPRPEPNIALGVYDHRGHRVAGAGPLTLEQSLAGTLSGHAVSSRTGATTVEVVPVSSGERVIAVVRAASPVSAVRFRVIEYWLGLAGLCCLAAGCAGALAAWQSRRLVVPLVNLTAVAADLGEGDFSVQAMPSGIREIDAVGGSLDRTAERLASMLERERSFTASASHQLRTPLTQLQLELEAGLASSDDEVRAAASAAMATAEQLSRTIDDVLAVARVGGAAGAFEADDLLDMCREQWQGPLAAANRPLRVHMTPPLRVAASLAACRQILHVLLDNALRHGRGAVTLTARESHGAVAIDVADEGSAPTFSIPESGRLGLSLAHALARAQNGRLLVDQQESGTRVTVLLPKASGQQEQM
jgi:signal transduction histidine kinase